MGIAGGMEIHFLRGTTLLLALVSTNVNTVQYSSHNNYTWLLSNVNCATHVKHTPDFGLCMK